MRTEIHQRSDGKWYQWNGLQWEPTNLRPVVEDEVDFAAAPPVLIR